MFLPDTRIRFDWCKSLIWLLLVMQACTRQFLCCATFIYCFGLSVFFYCIIMRRNCVGSYRISLDHPVPLPTMVCSSRRVWSVTFHNIPTHKTNFMFHTCTYRLCMPLNPVCTHHRMVCSQILPSLTPSQPLSVFTIVPFSILWIYAEAHSFFGCKYVP